MKINYECGACFLRQAKEAMDLASDDEDLKIELMNDIFTFLSSNFYKTTNSNKTGSTIHNMIQEKTGCEDPYINEKIAGNKIALKYLPAVKEVLKKNNSLENYVKIAIIGNILDFGAFTIDTDVGSLISSALERNLAVKDIDEFENALKKYGKVLYLVDNTGEIVFDKLLLSKIKQYDLDITIAVKSRPIINDACRQDAINVGLDHDFIISKGMGNYEGLTEIDLSSKEVFFLLCSKCTTISKNIGVNLHDMLLLKNRN